MKLSVGSGDNKGRCAWVVVSRVKQSWVGRADQEADKKETNDVEQGDSPEDLLDGTGKGLGGVLGFGGGKTDEFGSTEGESSRDEDTC